MTTGANDLNIYNFAMQENDLAKHEHLNLRALEELTQLSKHHCNERACCIKRRRRMA
jgi:hypothetical protein